MDDDSQSLNKANKKKEKIKSESRILRISFAGSVAFLVAEIVMAIVTHSRAVLADCVYDIADMAMLVPFMILIPLLYKPVTEKRPYGYSQIESLFILIKSGLLIVVTVQLIVSSIKLLLSGGHDVDAGVVAIFELAVSGTCVAMYLLLNHLNKAFSSPTVKAELYIWKLDSISTLGVGAAFLVQVALAHTSIAWVTQYSDPVIAIVISSLLLREPIGMFIESLRNLILFAPRKEVFDQVKKFAEDAMEGCDFHLSFLDVTKTGRKLWVEVFIVQDGDTMNIPVLKRVRSEIVASLLKHYDNVYVEIVPELENM
ncbi:MAG: cation diffusion facilitator family transporter [Anaerovoracaceae bacterium]|jgi:cation diffusion facilitator family transporter